MKNRWIAFAPALALIIVVFGSCSPETKGNLNRVAQLDKQPAKGSSLQELKKAVEKYQKLAAQKVHNTGQLGVYWKLLAVKYMENDMYGPARDAIREAIDIYPENPILFNIAGVVSARFAKSKADEKERNSLTLEAERYYKRAVELDPELEDALYGLAVLYDFELGSPSLAEPLLKRLLEKSPSNWDAQFLLARICVETGRTSEAIRIYDRIAESSAPESYRLKADSNRTALSGGRNGT